MSKAILVTGATGAQGGAVVKTLLAEPNDFTILAVTRNPDGAGAKRLAESSRVKVIKGDLDDVPALFANAKEASSNIWGVYSVTLAQGLGSKDEIAQGKNMIDAALQAKVKHFVFGSVDRGGDSSEPTDVPHFATKHTIEHYLFQKTQGTDMRYTVLRPVAYIDNFAGGFMPKVLGSVLRVSMPRDKKLQFVATKDIGYFAAQAFLHPDAWANRSVALAGDSLTLPELEAAFKEESGKPMPETYRIVAYAILWLSTEFNKMTNFWVKTGFGADITELKKEHPGLQTVREWIRENKHKLP